jgi:hypothetical protein
MDGESACGICICMWYMCCVFSFYHACMRSSCPLQYLRIQTRRHPVKKGFTYKDVYEATVNSDTKLRKMGFKVETVWSCQVNARLKQDSEMRKSYGITTANLNSFKEPIAPRSALYGGRVEGYRSFVSLTDTELRRGVTIEHYDGNITHTYRKLERSQ